MRKKIIVGILGVLLVFGGFSSGRADGWFHPFKHRCPQPAPAPVVYGWSQEGIFKTQFLDGHVGYAFGFVNGDGYIYVYKEVPDPFHPGVGPDVEQIFKDLEHDILDLFKRHHDKLVAPKTPVVEQSAK